MISKNTMSLYLCFVVISFLWVINAYANPYNLWVSGLYTARDVVSQGDTIKLFYQIRATHSLGGQLNMAILIKSGSRRKWVRNWSVPYSQGTGMNKPGGFNASMTIRIPNWPNGTYSIGINANANKSLVENNYDDDYMQIPIAVIRPFDDGTVASQSKLPLSVQGEYPYNHVCGNNTLVVVLDRDHILPGEEFNIKAQWIRKTSVMPGFQIQMEANGGIFPPTGRYIFTGITDQRGLVRTQWRTPSYINSGTGEVRHSLKISVFSGHSVLCTKQVPLIVRW